MKSVGKPGGAGIAKLASGIPLILLALAAWVVALAGVSVVRHEARSDSFNGINGGSLGFSWFVIAATAFVLLLALIYLFGMSFSYVANSHSGIVGLLAVICVLNILLTRDWNTARKQNPYSTKLGKGAVTAFAGFLSLAVLTALLILVVGNHHTSKPRRENDVYQTSNVHSNPVGSTPAVATHTAV